MMSCTCGEPEPHVTVRRETFDGVFVSGWSDGAITGCLGGKLAGVPMSRARTQASHDLAHRTMDLFMGEVCLHRADELGRLYDACRKVASKHGIPGDVLKLLAAPKPIAIPWRVISRDRDGKLREKQAIFRLGPLAGVAILYERGKGYEIGRSVDSGRRNGDRYFDFSGVVVANAAALQRHLRELIDLNTQEAGETK